MMDLFEHVRTDPAQLDRLELEFSIKGAGGHAEIVHDGDGHVGLGHGGGGTAGTQEPEDMAGPGTLNLNRGGSDV